MNSMIICLIIFAAMIVLFFNRKLPMAFTSMGVVVALFVTGCVDAQTVFAGFGNNNVLTMAGMFIVAAGLSRTQMVNNITKLLYKITKGSFTRVLASYILVIFLLGQFVPSLPALFAMVYPLVMNMCSQLKVSPSKMMYPIAVTVVSTSFVIEPIGPYAAWYVTQNGYLESYGWTGEMLSMWNETMVFLSTTIVTLLLTIFVLPRMMPDEPDIPLAAISGPSISEQEPLSPVREVIGYGVFILVVIGLMPGLPSWAVTMAGAAVVTLSGVLTEQQALVRMNMSMVLLYAGVTVMGEALGNTGAAQRCDQRLHHRRGVLHRVLPDDFLPLQPRHHHRAHPHPHHHLQLHRLRPPRPGHPVLAGVHVVPHHPHAQPGGAHGHAGRRLHPEDHPQGGPCARGGPRRGGRADRHDPVPGVRLSCPLIPFCNHIKEAMLS